MQLPFKQLYQRYRVLPSLGVVGNYQPQFIEPSDERGEVRFIVHRGFIHVVQYLLWDGQQISHSKKCIGTHHISQSHNGRSRKVQKFALTLIEAICEYVAGHSFVFPIVKKNRLSRLKTSASVESRRLLYVVLSSRTSFNFVTVHN